MMSDNGPSLKELLERFANSDGPSRLIILHQIRTYLNAIGPDRASIEISEIDSVRDLNIVVGAGPRGKAYYMLLRRRLELM